MFLSCGSKGIHQVVLRRMEGQVQLLRQALLFEIWLNSTKPELTTTQGFALDSGFNGFSLGVTMDNLKMNLEIERLEESMRTSFVYASNVSAMFVSDSGESGKHRVVVLGWESAERIINLLFSPLSWTNVARKV